MSKDVNGTASGYAIGQIQINDLVITNQVGYDSVNVGDVVIYNSKAGLICHRVTEKYITDGYQYVVTRGDANQMSDAPILYENVKGKAIGVVPGVGVVVSFLQSWYMIVALGVSGFLIFGIMFVFQLIDEKDQKEKKEEKQE